MRRITKLKSSGPKAQQYIKNLPEYIAAEASQVFTISTFKIKPDTYQNKEEPLYSHTGETSISFNCRTVPGPKIEKVDGTIKAKRCSGQLA